MWLRNIKDVYHLYQKEVDTITDEERKVDRLVELNVKEQVMHLAQTSIIQKAWQNDNRPQLHGWVYGLKDGIINSVLDMVAGTRIDPIYEYSDL
jgi:carbonic anhydrase